MRTVYDCAAGTGGFLSSAIEQVYEWNPNARLVPYAQELNPETYAISVADKLINSTTPATSSSATPYPMISCPMSSSIIAWPTRRSV